MPKKASTPKEEPSAEEMIPEIIKSLKNMFKKPETPDNSYQRAELCSNLAVKYWEVDNTRDARKYFALALKEYRNAKEEFKIAATNGAMGALLLQIGEYDPANSYLLEAYDYWKNKTYLNERLACLQSLGIVNLKLENIDEAADYVLLAMQMSMQLKDEDQFAQSVQILLEHYEAKQEFDMVKELKLKSLEFWDAMDLPERQLKTLIDLGVLEQILDHYPEAIQFFKKAFNLAYHQNDLKKMFLSQGFIAETYFHIRDLQNAKNSYISAFKLAVFIREITPAQKAAETREDVERMRAALLMMGVKQDRIASFEQEAVEETQKQIQEEEKGKEN